MDSWDQAGLNWDSGQYWDGQNLNDYQDLITSEHNDKPNFMAVIAATLQPLVDMQAVTGSMMDLFDLDSAVGVQLDAIGLWVGISRYLSIPLEGVYFSLDIAGIGFDEGTWFGPFDPVSGLTALPDDAYRTLLRAEIGNNHWDGSIPDAYRFFSALFPGNTVLIQDNGNMSMYLGVIGSAPISAVELALLTNGYLDIKPVGVRIAGYVTPTTFGVPLFGMDAENSTISGFDTGSFAAITGGR